MKRTLILIAFYLLAVPFIKAQLKASFIASPNKGCSPATIKFINQSTGSVLSYYWDLGNGNTSTVAEPKAIYYTPGFYTIKLIITDSKGKKDSIIRTNYVEVFKKPVAKFDAQTLKGCTPFDPKLTDKCTRGSGMITDWTWDYGDGKVLTGQSPAYSYTTEGTFNISLLIKDANGCIDTLGKRQYIVSNATPQVLFVADKTTNCSYPFTVNFTNKSTGLKSGDQFDWNFGDGTRSGDKNPKKTYTDTGSFTVTLNVKPSNGCNTSEKINNYINILNPKPSFNKSSNEICENNSVVFTSTSKPSNIKYICDWDFGDGNTAKGNKVINKYKSKGTYNVKLNISMPDGTCKESLSVPNAVKVLPKPVTDFTISDTLFCKPGYLDTFIDKTKGAVSREWYLEETVNSMLTYRLISTNKGVIVNIKKPGYSSVMLYTSDGTCSDSLEKKIFKDSIIPKFTLDTQKGCRPLKVKFKDITTSQIPITQRLWDLGDGNYQSQDSFEYTYTKAGMYIVKLTVKTESECSFTSQDTIWAEEKPDLTFDFPYTEACNTYSLKIANAKNINSQIPNHWEWFVFNEKTDSGIFDRRKILDRNLKKLPGTYDIKLVAGKNDCYDTLTKRNILRILPPYVAYGLGSDTCAGYPYTLYNASDSADEIRWIFKDSIVKNKNSLIIKRGDPWPIRLWGTNYKSGCKDSVLIDAIDTGSRRLGFNYTGSLCSPAKLRFHNWYFLDYEEYIWNWGDGTRDTNFEYYEKTFKEPGKYTVWLIGRTNECRDSIESVFEVTGPKVSVSVEPKSGCGPLTVKLINKTTGPSYKNKYWQISGQASIPVTSDTMSYTLKKPGPLPGGKYEVGLSIQDQNGCTATAADTVQVIGKKFDLELLTMATCSYPKLTLRPIFEQGTDTKNLNYFWDIGDGRKYNGSIVDYSYKNAGTYNVNLKIIDENSCVTERDTLIVNKEKSITANFLADKLDADCPPLRVNFVPKSETKFGKIVKYLWDFGDGSSSSLVNPSHVYLLAGKFTVTLTVTDDLGCSDKIIYKDLILIDGPIGKYSFDKKSGCTPLFVNFTSVTSNTFKQEWDMGDGVIIEDSLKTGHIYTRVGNYIPLLVLADSFGCKYTLPPIDTIKVFPNPLPQFAFTTPCIKQTVYFTNTSNPLKGAIKKSEWDFGDGDTSARFEPTHIFKTKGTFNVKLKVWNTAGCEAEIIRQVVIKNIEAGFKPQKEFYCSGQMPIIVNTSKSDTSFKEYSWFLNGSLLSTKSNPVLPKLSSGVYNITLAVKDNFGCTDTIYKSNGLLIGDTVAPGSPFIYRVSVINDNSVVLDFSGFRSFDFKEYIIYGSENEKIASVTNVSDTSKIINSLNTLHKVYCYKVTATNLCAFESDINLALQHCTVENKATGELKRVDLKWNAYKGWPVNKYEVFREDIGMKGKYDYLATVDGTQLNYTDTNVYCKIEHFYKIKAFENGGYSQISWSDTAAAKPKFANSVPPNNTIRATVDFDKEITIEWTGSGSPRIPIQEYVLEKSEDGVHYKWYQSFAPDKFDYTDKKVLVDDKSYFYRTYAIDTCELRSPFTNFAKTILLKADTTVTERPFVTWSAYQGWTEGVNEYEVQRKKPDGTFVTIGITSANDSIMVDNVTDLNGYPYYCYRVIGYKNAINGKRQIFSISNEDCAPVRSRVFAANAFTINGDNLNETFDIKGLYIRDYNIKIFTRWGEMIFESNDMNVDWDGYYQGKLCQMDAYIWIIKAVGVDDVNWPMTGTVTIIR